MLADSYSRFSQSGVVGKSVNLQASFLYELLDFIADELPSWRDRIDRDEEDAETALTAQLCAHLTSVARMRKGWDILQFRTEVPDEVNKGRKIDLVPSACASTIYVDGRRCTEFDILLPIECKRLPTPKQKDRDEREYVVTQNSSTGGIQRFKLGHHGSRHKLGAMIAYIQQGSATVWFDTITTWVENLVQSNEPHWSNQDTLTLVESDQDSRISIYRSKHTRTQNLDAIELRHLWLEMNRL
ncbi:hypothetical protein BH596_21580 [Pseudomonas aeruginosa]|nr:hypothetical protein BH596_21580 [Pseudomonas aeruginosa]